MLLRVTLTCDQDSAIHCDPMPAQGVQQCSLLGWSFFAHGLSRMSLGHMTYGRFFWNRDREGCVAKKFVKWAVPWLAPMWMGLIRDRRTKSCVRSSSLEVSLSHPLNLLSPALNCARAVSPKYSHRHHANERGNFILGVKNTSETRTSWGIASHFLWPKPLWGHEQAF